MRKKKMENVHQLRDEYAEAVRTLIPSQVSIIYRYLVSQRTITQVSSTAGR